MPVTFETIATVRSSPLLSEFSDEDLQQLTGSMELQKFAKGTRIVEQDHEGGPLFILLAGQVGVLRKSPKDPGKERFLAVIGVGESIGEMALVDRGPRSATVVALEDTETLELTPDQYQAMRESNPKLAIKMALGIFRLLSHRLRQINKSLELVHYWMFA